MRREVAVWLTLMPKSVEFELIAQKMRESYFKEKSPERAAFAVEQTVACE